MRDASIPLLFTVGLASAFVGDIAARASTDAHHAGAAHLVHTALVAVPMGLIAAMALREERIVAATLIVVAGWLVGLGVLAVGV